MRHPFLPVHEAPGGAELHEARHCASLTLPEAAAWLGVHRSTLARAEAGQVRVQLGLYRLLLILGGACPWPRWHGWRVAGDRLYAPDLRDGYDPAQLHHAHWHAEHARALAAELDQARRALILERGRNAQLRARVLGPKIRVRDRRRAMVRPWRPPGARPAP